ncbi:NAD(P)-dependent alcohol dehydrogenase [Pseudoalteromonas sp. MM17-2]|uniref:NADPH-dependent aldehyde reductase Ahr n=1 Tax=Pseudoalteromonas sp. MM17-2 TaxID=2917753 RepID=UPI001EF44ED7|nr:NAD(P)-dependent alcohol dehydrogenase [Pseudoalteromonas sp. MM17-2]MCG7546178.1 NAD(P)-dependent alcohol dehydrogenase [Pseudoalteromonas sp. MM17-2]
MTINAYAAMEAGQALEPYQYDPGELAADEVEIAVDHCGICHSDLSMIDNEWGMSEYPLVGGHEVIGRIEKVGRDVSNLEVGQTVGLGWHSGYCGHCPSCDDGDQNLCASAQGTIIAHHGGFADKVRAQSKSVIPLPKGLDAKAAGPLFCGGITVFNPLVQFDIKPTDKVAVIGIGGLGHLALQFLNAWGCEVTAFSSSDSKAKEAKELGAHHIINSRSEQALEEAAGQFDFIISTVNVKLDWNAYINTLKPKGRLHFVGATLEPLDLSVFGLLMGQRSVSASPVGSPGTIAKMLDFAAQHNIAPQIETFKFDDVNAALDHVREGKARYRVVLTR